MTKAPRCRRLKLLKLRTKLQQRHAGDKPIESSPLKDKMTSNLVFCTRDGVLVYKLGYRAGWRSVLR